MVWIHSHFFDFVQYIQIFNSGKMEICGLLQDYNEEMKELSFKGPLIGKGNCKNGKRRRWTKRSYFEQDLLSHFSKELDSIAFKSKFASYTPVDISRFFKEIKEHCIKPRETMVHARNKLLLWIDRNHNELGWSQVAEEYQIGKTTGKNYVEDVEKAILMTFENTRIIAFPGEVEKRKMIQILKRRKAHMPTAIFALDGKHCRCSGKIHTERLSWKYRWQPCFNCLFVIERVFGTVCAFNLDMEAKKHDIEVLRESQFFQNIEEKLNGSIVLADKGYIGSKTNLIIPALNKKSRKKRVNRMNNMSDSFWKAFNDARNDSERAFGQFFYNKFPLLGNWQGKSKSTFNEWARSVVCCIILYNYVRRKNKQFL